MKAHEDNHSLHLQLALETVVELKETLTKGEPLVFKLTEYCNKREKNELFFTSPFYTSNGYHMIIKVYPNGNEEANSKGKYLSIYASILKGKFDIDLSWPLIGEITFTLLNPQENKKHVECTVTLISIDDAKVGETWGISSFISLSEIAQYLKDDTLYFKVSICDKKHWLQCTI